jgi:hypothetical protein
MLASQQEQVNAQVRYELRAWLHPVNDDGWANKETGISKFRASRSFILCNFKEEYPKIDFRHELKLEIGGMMGFGSSSCKTLVTFT